MHYNLSTKLKFYHLSNSSYFTISSKNLDSKDYHESAHEFAEKMNELQPLAAAQVQQDDCPLDTIVHLEQHIETRPARHGFFGHLGIPKNTAVEHNMAVNETEDKDIEAHEEALDLNRTLN